jgi:FkbM family methyltransferase
MSIEVSALHGLTTHVASGASRRLLSYLGVAGFSHLGGVKLNSVHRRNAGVRVKALARAAFQYWLGELRWHGLRLRLGKINKSTYYDHLTEMVMQKVLTPAAVCVDVGCHVGQILRIMMRYAPQGQFLAFEPIPSLCAKLRTDFDSPNVAVYELALSDAVGISQFNLVTSNPAYSGLRKRRYDRPNEIDTTIKVSTDTFDNVIAHGPNQRIDFIKIDVEGAEYHVLAGAKRCLTDDKPVVVFEHGLGATDCYDKGPEEVFDLLQRCGMRVSLMQGFLLGKSSLTRAAFCDQFRRGKNYYFVAHP